MATFLINTAGVSQAGTPADDFFIVESGAFGASLQGLGADDSFDFSNFTGGSTYGNGSANGNEGNDDFDVVVSGINLVGNFFGGGQGNDNLEFAFRSADKVIGNLIQGGAGNDTITFSAGGTAIDLVNNTINGNAGNDLINIVSAVVSGSISNFFVGGGADTDVIDINLSSDSGGVFRSAVINGGLGVDVIDFGYTRTANGLNINGGTFGTTDSTDVSDNILVTANNLDNSTVAGNSGNDVIDLDIAANTSTNVLIAGNAGNDTLLISGNTDYFRSTIGGGAGDDFIVLESAGQFSAGSNSVIGGLGNDTIEFDFGSNNSASDGVTLQGGAGADLFYASGALVSGNTSADTLGGGNFSYASLADSTLAARDTIVVGSAGSGTFTMTMPGAVDVVANGRIGSTNLFATAGVVSFTAVATSTNLTLGQMVALLDANIAEGEAVAFRLNTGFTTGDSGFVFVKGATDDLLVEFSKNNAASSFSAGDTTLANGANNRLDLNLG